MSVIEKHGVVGLNRHMSLLSPDRPRSSGARQCTRPRAAASTAARTSNLEPLGLPQAGLDASIIPTALAFTSTSASWLPGARTRAVCLCSRPSPSLPAPRRPRVRRLGTDFFHCWHMKA